jgi:LysR substrate binding domain.
MPIVLVCAPENPLASKERVFPEDMSECNICLPPNEYRSYDYLARIFKTHKMTFARTIFTNSLVAVKSIVKHNLSVAFMPQHAVFEEINRNELVPVLIEGLNLSYKMICMHNVQKQLPDFALEFMQIAREVLDRDPLFSRYEGRCVRVYYWRSLFDLSDAKMSVIDL